VDAPKVEAIVPTRADWLDQVREEALRPDLAICDPHHHLWDRGGAPYFLPEFLADAKTGHRIVSSIYVEAHARYRADGPDHMKPVGEVEFADTIARDSEARGGPRVCAGIVGHADLRLGDRVHEVLDAMIAASPRFRGIRHIAAWHPDPSVKGTVANPPPGLLRDEQFRRGFKALAANNLTYDSWALHTQLVDLRDLALTCPDVKVVMDHTGGCIGMGSYVGKRDAAFGEWRTAIRALAQAPNVFAKIGGFGMRLWGFGFHEQPIPPTSEALSAALRPYVEATIEAFGPSRCMFESNFPVDKGSFSYVVLWNAFKRITQNYSEDEQNMLFRGTAERVYSLTERG
jgi:L-fuconolactonase